MLSILMRQRRMWAGWVIGFVLYAGRRWLLRGRLPNRAMAKEGTSMVRDKGQVKATDKRQDPRWKKEDRMKLRRNWFVGMFSISTV